ncbi:MAG: hypothetical protein N5P05_003248 [Chroococcopsis gigantea SAG 12.99]|jgi:hypothetical protein|nr:hypothetical protein [Chlorogloea purpurea SAG 13.99]MDV3001642.1 hypothetical protein [Chroococcopsis gigantea SAG 12.99]
MKLAYLLTVGLLTANTCLLLAPHSIAQTPPATTFVPGPWQPVARVNPQRPVTIKIVNSTDLLLDYDLTANIKPSPQQIVAGDSTVLKGFNLPAYILINNSQNSAVRNPLSLIYSVDVNDNNEVTLTITTAPNEIPGYTTLNINRQGGIFIY